MPDTEPVPASLFETLHRAQWIASHDGGKEYGRLLKSWIETGGDGILRDWYLQRVDQAQSVLQTDKDWELLRTVLPPGSGDRELFNLIVRIDDQPIALDDGGNWRVQVPVALEIAKSYLSTQSPHSRHGDFWLFAVGGVLVAVVLARCA